MNIFFSLYLFCSSFERILLLVIWYLGLELTRTCSQDYYRTQHVWNKMMVEQ